MGQFEHNGILYEELPNGKARVIGPVGSSQPQPLTLGTPKPKEPKPPRIMKSGETIGIVDDNGNFTPTYVPPEKPSKDAASGGVTAEARSQAQAKIAAARQLRQQLQTVEHLFDQTLAQGRSVAEYIPTAENKTFDAAVDGLMPLARQAFRVPGSGADSEREGMYLEKILPNRWSFDEANRQRINQLKQMIDAVEREYGPIAGIEQQSPAPSQDSAQRVFEPQAGERLQIATGDTRTEANPAMQGANAQVNAMLKSGASDSEILRYLKGLGATNRALYDIKGQLVKVREFQKNYPGYKGDYRIDLERHEVPNSAFNKIAASGPGTMLAAAGDAVTGYNLDSIIGATGGDAEQARLGLAMSREANPGWGLAGDVAGGVTAAMTGEAALARLGMAPGFGRALAADTAYGATAGAGMSDDGNRLAGAGIGALAGGVGSVGGQAVARGLGNVVSGVTDPSVQRLYQSGNPMSIGQAVGNSGQVGSIIKRTEDRLAGVPAVGDQITARRVDSIRGMNSRAFDRALEPIGKSVNGKVAEEAVEDAHSQVQQAFQDALRGKVAHLDVDFISETANAVQRLRRLRRNQIGDEVVDQIEEATRGYFDPQTGELTGENMQAMLASLREIRQAYKSDPLGKRIGDEVRKVERAVEGMFVRQAPEVMPKYNAAKQAYRRVSILADAVNRAKNKEGVFTPGQLGMADRANSKKFDGQMAAAEGRGQFHDFQRDAQRVIPNEVPDSGTAGRLATLAVPGMIAGSGAGVGYAAGDAQSGAAGGLGLASIAAALYTKQGQRALVAAAAKRSDKARQAGKKIKERARLAGAGGTSVAVQGTSGDR